MADKAFGVKQLNILGSGTPSIESPSDLNINAVKVAISTNLTVGGASTFTGNISANGNINANGNIVGDNSTNITGIAGVTASTLTGTLQTAAQTNITSVGTLGALTVSGNVNANGNIVGDNATNISGINSVTATTYYGSGANLTNLPGITTSTDASFGQVEWDVVNNGASSYRFTGPGNDGAEDNPDLYLVRGQRYIFNVNASGHPFLIRSSNGVTYSDGVINNGAAVGKVILNLQHDAPARLFYQCSAHSGMIGNIYVVGGDQVIAGVVTATTFSGNLTGTVNTAAQPNITSLGTLSSLSVTGNVSVGGTLTYDDVTNIDSVGLITARTGIRVLAGGINAVGVVTADSFIGGGINTTGTSEFTSLNLSGNLKVAGVSTFTGNINANGNIVGDNATNISGINSVTATSYYGNGSFLSGIATTGDAGFQPDSQENLYAGTGAGAASDADTCCNIGIGYSALHDNCAGDRNIALGICAGNKLLTGVHNIFLGSYAGRQLTTGSYNTFFGYYAGQNNAGNKNVAIGCMAGVHANGGQSHNVFLGTYAGCCAKANRNIALGYQALKKSTSGGCNVVLGDTAACAVTSGCFNLVSGFKAGLCISSGSCNIFLGKCAGNTTTTGDRNIAIGHDVELSSATGSNQLGIGSGTSLWIEGDSSYNVTLAGIATAYASGIVSATKFCGDGSCLTGISAGFSADAQVNLFSNNTCSGCNLDGTACNNIFLGGCAGKSVTSSHNNVILGSCAGATLSGGRRNILIGQCSGFGLTTAVRNIIIGCSGKTLTTGPSNVWIGMGIGDGGTAGNTNDSVAIGHYAGHNITNAHYNLFLGSTAGYSNTSGCRNIFLGHRASYCNITGHFNIAIGTCLELPGCRYGSNQLVIGCVNKYWIVGNSDFNVGIGTTNPNAPVGAGNTNKLSVGIVSAYQLYGDGSNLTGLAGFAQDSQGNLVAGTGAGAAKDADTCFNIMIGCNSGAALNAGDHNILLGCHAGKSITSGNYNLLFGRRAGCSIDSGSSNVLIHSKTALTTGCKNIAILGGSSMGATSCCNIVMGSEAGYNLTGNSNIVLGAQAGCDLTGNDNILLGHCSGTEMTSGCNNIALGCNAGKNATSGSSNIALGDGAMSTGTISGTKNIAIGQGAGKTLSSGYQNVIIGDCAGQCAGPYSNNVIIGSRAGCKICGASNFFGGYMAGRNATTANSNVFIGIHAGKCNTTGDKNIFIGGYSGGETGSITGACNIAIGRLTSLPDPTGSNQLVIGDGTNRWIAGDSSYNVTLAGIATAYASGIVSATKFCGTSFYGDGSNLTGITAAGTGAIGGLTIKDEGVTVGTAGSVSTLNFVGGSVVAIASSGAAGVATITVSGGISTSVLIADAQGNLLAGKQAGHCIDSNVVGDNIFLGCYAGKAGNSNDLKFNIALGYHAAKGAVGGSELTGACNIIMGVMAGQYHTSGLNNIFLGKYSGQSTNATGVSGNNNVALGSNSGNQLTSGCCNIFLGPSAGQCMTTGLHNIAIGAQAGRKLQNNCNIAIGVGALCGTGGGIGYCNIAIGLHAGLKLTNGHANIFMGTCAGASITGSGAGDGSYNIGFGRDALGGAADGGSTSGNFNAVMGHYSGKKISSGSSNTLMGRVAGCSITSGGTNTFLGSGSGKCVSTGSKNIAIGKDVTPPSNTGNCQLVIGVESSYWMVGNSDFNVGIGTTNPNAPVGAGNTAKLSVGILSAYQLYGDGSNLSGLAGFSPDDQENLVAGTGAGAAKDADTCFNIMLGHNTGAALCAGDCNVLLGYEAGHDITTASQTVIIGKLAGSKLISQDGATLVGCGAGQYYQGGNGSSVMIGCNAGKGVSTYTGDRNTYIGNLAGEDNGSGFQNTFIGFGAGQDNTDGDSNVAVGYEAGKNVRGCCNISIGLNAGQPGSNATVGCANIMMGAASGIGLCSGNQNIFLGSYSGKCVSTGSKNIALGNCAGRCITTGTYNIAFGAHTMACATHTGCENVAIGKDAGSKIQSGKRNIAVGSFAGQDITSGNCNIFMGLASGCASTTGCANIALGVYAGKGLSSGGCNVFLGHYTACNIATGTDNFVVGNRAGKCLADADHNIMIGSCAGVCATSAECNIIMGKEAGRCFTTGHANIIMGKYAARGANNTAITGYNNIIMGSCAALCMTSGDQNVFIGNYVAHCATATSSGNVALGPFAAKCITSANSQIFIGCKAGAYTKTGSNSIAMGTGAGKCFEKNCYNIALGSAALQGGSSTPSDNDGVHNVALGTNAGCSLTTGDCNIFGTFGAGSNLTTGSANVFFGHNAGRNFTTGSGNLALGTAACGGPSDATGSGNVLLGNIAGACISGSASYNTFIGYGAATNFICTITGSRNIIIGCRVGIADSTGDCQLAIGVGNTNWISGDSNVNVTLAGIVTAYATGIVSATKFCGDGSALTGISAGGFSADADLNLFASNTCSGCDLNGTSGCFNVFLGACAGKKTTSGERNIYVGDRAGCDGTNASRNVFLGYYAGAKITSGSNNIALGFVAGCSVCSGPANVMMGFGAGRVVTTGGCNIFIGKYAGRYSSTGSNNIALGNCAGKCLGACSNNIVIGNEAACCATPNSAILAIGYRAGKGGSGKNVGFSNIFIGEESGCINVNGQQNTFLGIQAGRCNDGSSNTFIGKQAGQMSTSSDHTANTYIGCGAGKNQVDGKRNIAIGCGAYLPRSSTSDQIVFTGGYGTFNGLNDIYWFYGCCNGGCAHVAIGTTNPDAVVGAALTSKLSVGIVSAYKLYGDGSNLTGISGGGGLSHWTESANTSSPNNVVAANRLIATGAGTTIDAVIQPKSTGAFLTNLPDGAAAGGNKRGCYAVDLQMKRSGAGCVAAHNFATISGGENNYSDSTHAAIGGGYGNCAGWNAAVAGGYNNKAGGNAGAVGGGYGNCAGYMSFVGGGQYNNATGTYASVLGGSSNNASGSGSLIVGNNSKTDGEKSLALGYKACTRNRDGSIAMAAHFNPDVNIGKLQSSIMHLRASTTDATQTVLTSRQAACSASTDNQLTIPTNAAYVFCGSVIANVTSGGDTHGWLFRGVMKRGSGNASLVGTPSIDDVAYDTGASGWSIALGVDTTNQALAVCVTGQSSTNITWATTVYATELQH